MTLPAVELSAPRDAPPAKPAPKAAPAPAKAAEPPVKAEAPPAAPAKSEPAPVTAAPALPAEPPAEAKPEAPPTPTLAVIPLDAPSDLAVVGRSLAEAIAQEAAKVGGLQVLAPAAVLEKLGTDRGAQVSHCGEAVGCYLGPATQLGATRVVGGWLDRSGANYRFGLVHIDVKTGKSLGRVQREVPIASRRIRSDVVAAAGPLLRGEAATTGTLVLLTEQPGADVKVDDKPAGKTPLEAKLPAGKHKVEVSQRGKVRVEPFWVDIPANGRAEQKVRLYDIPVSQRKPGEVETIVDMGKDRKRKK